MRAMTVVPGQKGTDPGWLGGLITRRVPLTSWTEALDRHPEDIKVVVDLAA
jgi:hypothetical protein